MFLDITLVMLDTVTYISYFLFIFNMGTSSHEHIG